MKKNKRVGILTSGGDAPGMNAAIRAAVRGSIYLGMEPYGISHGYKGMISGDIKPMNASSVSDILQRGGTILKTARSEEFMTYEGFAKALGTLKKNDIESVVIIGGDGSFRGGLKLAEAGINVMGVPGTIDNDLGYTDYTIGFDTAVNTVLSAISNVRDTSSSHERATIIEVMGRGCGDIAIWAGMAGGAESILVPELPIDIDKICDSITHGRKRGKVHNLIIKAEGVDLDSRELVDIIRRRTGMETREVVLGYIQRGGSPTANDRMLASSMAYKAIELINEGKVRNQAIGITGSDIVGTPLKQALKEEKKINSWCTKLAEILSI